MTDTLGALSEAGVSIWLDDLSRDRLRSGSLADLAARDHVVGVTTNPAIFARAIARGDAYGPQIRDLSARGVDLGEAMRALTTFDVRWACDVMGTSEAAAMRGRAALANARLAYQHYERVFSLPRWTALQAAGASPQRPLWASTSVKDPAYSDTRYVTGLVAPGVVNTMPEATLRAVADHGRVPADSIRGHYDQAQQVIDTLQDIGIDFGDVMQGLEDDAVTRFDHAWQQLGDRLAAALRGRPALQRRS